MRAYKEFELTRVYKEMVEPYIDLSEELLKDAPIHIIDTIKYYKMLKEYGD